MCLIRNYILVYFVSYHNDSIIINNQLNNVNMSDVCLNVCRRLKTRESKSNIPDRTLLNFNDDVVDLTWKFLHSLCRVYTILILLCKYCVELILDVFCY